MREIGRAVGLKSTSTVAYYLRDLARTGQLRHSPEVSRGLSVTSAASFPETPLLAVPLLGRVTAGLPALAQEDVEEIIRIPSNRFASRPDFALRVAGESMTGVGIHDGDLAFVHQQPTAEEGDIVVALLDDEATLKRFERTGDAIRLVAANPRFKPIVTRDVVILGRLVGILRTL